jgi:ornithine carbamoyltransferase
MALNLHNRDFLKEVDFTATELQFLLDLSHDLKRAKASGSEQQRLRGRDVALIFEKTSTRTRCAFERRLRPGRPRHLPGPGVLADRAQGVGR